MVINPTWSSLTDLSRSCKLPKGIDAMEGANNRLFVQGDNWRELRQWRHDAFEGVTLMAATRLEGAAAELRAMSQAGVDLEVSGMADDYYLKTTEGTPLLFSSR
jgi:hypothetical protein